jgi:hypothetical protein
MRRAWRSLVAGALLGLLLGGTEARGAAPASALAAPQAYQPSSQQQVFLDQLQRDTFRFFWDVSPAQSGLTLDRSPGPPVSSVAAVGFALTSYLVGVERGYVSRSEAAARTLATLDTLWKAPQGPAAEGVAGNNGLFYHFLDGEQGVRVWQSEVSTIDTALLMAGVLSAQAYFDQDSEVERAIRQVSDSLYRRVDWQWAYSPQHRPLLSMGWSPERGFLENDWAGYNEGMLLYVLALGSPTHPVDAQAWDEWTRSYHQDGHYGPTHLTFGPLFGHQYSHVWIDFRGIQDRYMQSRQTDYFANSVLATYANRAYCIANPGGWKGYGELVWGLTASDGPFDGGALREGATPFHTYWARGADASWDDGTIAPTAAGGSVPFAPEVAIPTLQHLRESFGDRIYGQYGFKDAFNLSYPDEAGAGKGWFDDHYLAIDQGPILLMIENYRTGFVWELLKKSAYVTAGLRRAGFAGGWLDAGASLKEGSLPGAAAPSAGAGLVAGERPAPAPGPVPSPVR